MALNALDAGQEGQRRRARRTAFWLMLLVVAIYGGFILLSVSRAHA